MSVCSAMLDMTNSCKKLKNFLIDGKLQPELTKERLGQANAVVGEFFLDLIPICTTSSYLRTGLD